LLIYSLIIKRQLTQFESSINSADSSIGRATSGAVVSITNGINKFEVFVHAVSSDMEETVKRLDGVSRELYAQSEILSTMEPIRSLKNSDLILDGFIDGMKRYAGKWVETFKAVSDDSRKVKCWAAVFNKYIEEELRHLSTQSVATNLGIYWSLLKILVKVISDIKDDNQKLCLWASTNVLPVDWYNWRYPPPDNTSHTNDFLDGYRDCLERVIKEYDEDIEVRRWVLVTDGEGVNTNQYGVELYDFGELRKQAGYFIGLRDNKPVSDTFEKLKIYFSYNDTWAFNYSTTHPIYLISDTERSSHNGEGLFRKRLLEYFADSLHSQPISENAKAAIINKGNINILRNLPDNSPDFLSLGLKAKEEGEDIDWVIVLSARINPTNDTCFIHVLTDENGLNKTRGFFAEIDLPEVSKELRGI